jgi:four helix bundle protein
VEVKSYKDLVLWQKGMDMTESVYRVSGELPVDERFGLISQLRRAAVSVPSNIAEGHQRSSTKDFLRFLSIASGSLAEVETLVELAFRLHSIHTTSVAEVAGQADEMGRMLRSLQKRLDEKLSFPRPSSLAPRP